MAQLLFRNFVDTFVFTKDCWSEQSELLEEYESNPRLSRAIIREQDIEGLIRHAEEREAFLREKNGQSEC